MPDTMAAMATPLKPFGPPLRMATNVGEILKSSPSSSSGSNMPYGIFIERRRVEHAANGITVSMMTLKSEWTRLTPGEKEPFELEAKARREASKGTTSDFLKRQQEEQKHRVPVRRIDPNAPAQNAKRSKQPKIEVPKPSFPTLRNAADADRDERRREMTKSLKTQAEERGSQVSTAPSHDANLEEISSRLTAPSLSFDWSCPTFEDNEGSFAERDSSDQDQGSASSLAVDLPQQVVSGNGIRLSVRSLLHRELRQKVSSKQVQSLLVS